MALEVQGERWRYTDGVLTVDTERAGGRRVYRGHRELGPEVPHPGRVRAVLVLTPLLQGVRATEDAVGARFADLSA